jgi:hypothetical protein
MKHTNKKCTKCGVKLNDDNWLKSVKKIGWYSCSDCRKEYMKLPHMVKRNTNRMYVNGKYVPQEHPLHKPGRFKTFEDAAFASLKGYTKTKSGYVYVLSNPAWKEWIKVGMAIDAEDRCNSLQTSSPLRDYRLLYARKFNNRRKAETKTMNKLKKLVKEHNGEWFKTDRNTVQEVIERLSITL